MHMHAGVSDMFKDKVSVGRPIRTRRSVVPEPFDVNRAHRKQRWIRFFCMWVEPATEAYVQSCRITPVDAVHTSLLTWWSQLKNLPWSLIAQTYVR
jgi:hypothetical protein